MQRNGLNDLLSIMLESMMMAERGEFLREDSTGNKGNGFRPGRTYGQGKRLEFRIPRDRYGNFLPQILAILRDQEEECEKLAGVLYAKGLAGTLVAYLTATAPAMTKSIPNTNSSAPTLAVRPSSVLPSVTASRRTL